MSNSKRDQRRRKRRPTPEQKARQPGRERGAPTDAKFVKLDIHAEIRHITRCAQAADSRIVTLGNLVLFSTPTGDAWLLDSEDNLALCLCREGQPQPFRIIDTPAQFAIEWKALFRIQGEAFTVQERTGNVVTIHGYPTAEIAAACQALG